MTIENYDTHFQSVKWRSLYITQFITTLISTVYLIIKQSSIKRDNIEQEMWQTKAAMR